MLTDLVSRLSVHCSFYSLFVLGGQHAMLLLFDFHLYTSFTSVSALVVTRVARGGAASDVMTRTVCTAHALMCAESTGTALQYAPGVCAQ